VVVVSEVVVSDVLGIVTVVVGVVVVVNVVAGLKDGFHVAYVEVVVLL
jgi:hypothetical protein